MGGERSKEFSRNEEEGIDDDMFLALSFY